MGLLDDAIRQHLDLKRQHGADPGDVAEQEREAFGPIKRGDLEVTTGAEDQEAPGADAEPASADEPALEPAASWEQGSERVAPEPGVPPHERAAEPPVIVDEAAPGSVVLPEEPAAPTETVPFEAPLDVPFAPTAEPDAYAPPHLEPVPPVEEPERGFEDIGEPTQEYSVLDEEAPADPQPDPATGEHDELEQTPDFLEETPEHDRLWFEQKPPRDFDF